LVKLPFDPIADKNQFGEIDVQTRYYDPLLSSIVADTKGKVVLRWPNKEATLTTGIRPDDLRLQCGHGLHKSTGTIYDFLGSTHKFETIRETFGITSIPSTVLHDYAMKRSSNRPTEMLERIPSEVLLRTSTLPIAKLPKKKKTLVDQAIMII
jgi:hypothetical protein